MLTFLRKLRKSLIDAGATRKYLLYAAGEILLVMIGILLALQVNNWNEWRKERMKENEILGELQVSVQTNLDVLKRSERSIRRSIESTHIILSVLNNKSPYSDTLIQHFTQVIPIGLAIRGRLSQSGYKALEGKGFDIIQNTVLRNRVINLFEVHLPSLIASNEDNVEWYHIYVTENFKSYMYLNDGPHIMDYDALLGDIYFRTMAEHRMRQKRVALRDVGSAIEEMNVIRELIKVELQGAVR